MGSMTLPNAPTVPDSPRETPCTSGGNAGWHRRPSRRRKAHERIVLWVVCSSAILPSAQALQFNIPSRAPVQCIPYPAIWSGGVAPYTFSIVPGSQGPPIEQFPNLSENRFTWSSDLPGGTSIFLKVEDATGASVESQLMSMEDGLRSDCLKGTPQSQQPSSDSGATTTTSPPPAPPQSTSTDSSPSSAQAASSPQTSDAAPSPTVTTVVSSNAGAGSPTQTNANTNASTDTDRPPSSSTATPDASSPSHFPSSSSTTGVSPGSGAGRSTEGATGGSVTATGAPTRPSAGAGSSGVPSVTQISGTSLPPPVTSPGGARRGLSMGVIVGIVLGALAVLAIVAFCLVHRHRRFRRTFRTTKSDPFSVAEAAESGANSKAHDALRAVSEKDLLGRDRASLVSTLDVVSSVGAEPPLSSYGLLNVDPEPASKQPNRPLSDHGHTPTEVSPPREPLVETVPRAAPTPPPQPLESQSPTGTSTSTSGEPGTDSKPHSIAASPCARAQGAITRVLERAREPESVCETDGGIRLAGGPPGQAMPDHLVLPPPYRRYYP